MTILIIYNISYMSVGLITVLRFVLNCMKSYHKEATIRQLCKKKFRLYVWKFISPHGPYNDVSLGYVIDTLLQQLQQIFGFVTQRFKITPPSCGTKRLPSLTGKKTFDYSEDRKNKNRFYDSCVYIINILSCRPRRCIDPIKRYIDCYRHLLLLLYYLVAFRIRSRVHCLRRWQQQWRLYMIYVKKSGGMKK